MAFLEYCENFLMPVLSTCLYWIQIRGLHRPRLWHGTPTPIIIANMQLAMFPCCGVVNMHRAGVWIRVILYSSSIHPQPDQVQITSDIAHFHAINGNHYRGGQTVFDINCRWFVGDTDTHLTPCGPVAYLLAYASIQIP